MDGMVHYQEIVARDGCSLYRFPTRVTRPFAVTEEQARSTQLFFHATALENLRSIVKLGLLPLSLGPDRRQKGLYASKTFITAMNNSDPPVWHAGSHTQLHMFMELASGEQWPHKLFSTCRKKQQWHQRHTAWPWCQIHAIWFCGAPWGWQEWIPREWRADQDICRGPDILPEDPDAAQASQSPAATPRIEMVTLRRCDPRSVMQRILQSTSTSLTPR
jgi:hypothetical protein